MNERRALANRREQDVIGYEQGGFTYVAGVGRFDDGTVAEIFLHGGKPGSAIEASARDAAVILSIALQFGAPFKTLQHAVTRLHGGSAAVPIGRLLDLIVPPSVTGR